MPGTYAPRPLRHLMAWQVGGLRIKPYHLGRPEPAEPLVAAARAEAERTVAAARLEGGSEDLGFAILHQGADGTWLLMHWWAHGDILCELLSLDSGAGFVPVDHRPLMACVWELPVIGHERDAWVRHMMSGHSAPEAYLADRLPEGTV